MLTDHALLRTLLVTILPAVLAGGFGCGSASDDEHPDDTHAKHWGYEDGLDTFGPTSWGTEVDPDKAKDELCATGQAQTPIALRLTGASAAAPADLSNLLFNYQRSRLSMLNNGHTVQMLYEAGSTLSTMGGAVTYPLAQFHFHAPSEHTLDGVSYPMEMHLVHLDSNGSPAAVVGVFIKAGAANAALGEAFNALPQAKDLKSEPANAALSAKDLLPAEQSFLTYAGSLTTPPCSEGVKWFLMRTPIELSQEQIDAFTRIPGMAPTNRPIQPLNGRTVQADSTPAR
jgi:carbonic anhydrase